MNPYLDKYSENEYRIFQILCDYICFHSLKNQMVKSAAFQLGFALDIDIDSHSADIAIDYLSSDFDIYEKCRQDDERDVLYFVVQKYKDQFILNDCINTELYLRKDCIIADLILQEWISIMKKWKNGKKKEIK